MNYRQSHKTPEEEIDLVKLAVKVWNHRREMLVIIALITLAGIVYAFMAPKLYEANASFYKTEGEKQNMSGLHNLASQFGVGGALGGSELFNIDDLVKSRSMALKILNKKWETEKFDQPVSLIKYWEIQEDNQLKEQHGGLEKLGNAIQVFTDEETQLTNIRVLMPEPQLAADIANHIVQLVEAWIKEEQQLRSRKKMDFIEMRLDSVKKELLDAEEALKEFKEQNRITSLSPQLQIHQMRLQRQVNIKQEVYIVLQKELEMTKIDLVKETPVINLLDEATPPVLRAKPKRKLIVLLGVLAGLAISVMVIVGKYVFLLIQKEIHESKTAQGNTTS